jgi:hypothetical protein
MKIFRAFFVLAFVMAPLMCQADAFSFTLNTAPVSGSTLTLLFQFTDGSTPATPGNNSVTLQNFFFGTGGSAIGAATLNGGASGDVSGGFTLSDTGFSNTVEQQFVAGSSLGFTVNLSQNPEQPAPDEFAFSIEQISTTDVGGAFTVIDVGSAPVTFAASGNGDARDQVGSPTLTSSAPEPSTILLLGLGAAFAIIKRAHR